MGKASNFSLGRLLLQIAIGAMFTVAGIWALQGGGDAGVAAIRRLIDAKNVESILCIVFGVIELIAGVFLILSIFIGDKFGSFGKILMIIIMVVWIIAIVLIDFLGDGSLLNHGSRWNFLSWLYNFAYHLIVLGAIVVLQN
ncbi:MAG: hypothetical protein K5907_00335 [Treponema sp.]|nr:hypothetical protein [Treponema sp.]